MATLQSLTPPGTLSLFIHLNREIATMSEKQYDNTLTPDVYASLYRPDFTDQRKTERDPEVLRIMAEQEAFYKNHPIDAIYRLAVVGSITRRGGVIAHTSSNQCWSSQPHHHVALVGDSVVYPDGTQATITTGAGGHWQVEGKPVALVGSCLDNGDEITGTPQLDLMITRHQGIPMRPDFLTWNDVP